MKRHIQFAVACVFGLFLLGCGKGTGQSGTDSAKETPKTTAKTPSAKAPKTDTGAAASPSHLMTAKLVAEPFKYEKGGFGLRQGGAGPQTSFGSNQELKRNWKGRISGKDGQKVSPDDIMAQCLSWIGKSVTVTSTKKSNAEYIGIRAKSPALKAVLEYTTSHVQGTATVHVFPPEPAEEIQFVFDFVEKKK